MLSRKVVLCLLALTTPLPVAAETVTVGGTGAGLSTIRVLGAAATEVWPDLTIEVLPSLGSSGGIRALNDGALDLAVTARPLRDAEQASGLRAFHLADTPIAFVSSMAGDLSISSDRVAEMFAAPSARWPDGTPVRIILRPEQVAAYRPLRDHVPGFTDAVASTYLRPEVLIAATAQENVSLARLIEGSFTVATLAQIATEAPELTLVALDGTQPSPDRIADGSYPLSISFYLVASTQDSEPLRHFLEFVRSAEAASILSDAGLVPADHPTRLP